MSTVLDEHLDARHETPVLFMRLLQVGGVLLGALPVVASLIVAEGRPGQIAAAVLATCVFVFAITRAKSEGDASGVSVRVVAVWTYAVVLAASLSFIGTFAAAVVGTAVAP